MPMLTSKITPYWASLMAEWNLLNITKHRPRLQRFQSNVGAVSFPGEVHRLHGKLSILCGRCHVTGCYHDSENSSSSGHQGHTITATAHSSTVDWCTVVTDRILDTWRHCSSPTNHHNQREFPQGRISGFQGGMGPQIGRFKLLKYWSFSGFSWSKFQLLYSWIKVSVLGWCQIPQSTWSRWLHGMSNHE